LRISLTSIPESVSALTAERPTPNAKSNPVQRTGEAKKQGRAERRGADGGWVFNMFCHGTCKCIALDRASAGYFCEAAHTQVGSNQHVDCTGFFICTAFISVIRLKANA
jgi:hypothetical protein